jgi:peroxiredoxin Q/BCP
MTEMKLIVILVFCFGLAVVAGNGGSAQAAELKVGDKAPGFELPGTDGKTYKLSNFKGNKAVVIFWYPKAKTGG